MLDQAYLKNNFSYNPCTGEFMRKYRVDRLDKVYKPKAIGYRRKDGYIILGLNYQTYLAHRIAWMLIYGEAPKDSKFHREGGKAKRRRWSGRKRSRSFAHVRS